MEFGKNLTEELEIREIAWFVLKDLVLKTDEATHLGALDNDQAVYIDKVDTHQLFAHDVQDRFPYPRSIAAE